MSKKKRAQLNDIARKKKKTKKSALSSLRDLTPMEKIKGQDP
jgi:hypothetical protein